MAQRLRNSVRDCDTVARLGGDEFAVLVEDAEDPRTALVVADRIMRAMAPPFDVADTDLHVSCSIGVAVAKNDGDTGEGFAVLLGRADAAMYEAKRRGGNQVALAP